MRRGGSCRYLSAMAQDPKATAATMVANLKEKTGKTLEAWLKVAAASKLD